jgi:Zn-dependent protease with chaperone function
MQAYFSNDFMEFDEVNKFLIGQIFDNRWQLLMQAIRNLSSIYMLITVVLFTIVWVAIKKISSILEIKFIVITSLCSIFLEKSLILISKQRLQTIIFPNDEALLAVVVYGFCAYLIAKHTKKLKIITI